MTNLWLVCVGVDVTLGATVTLGPFHHVGWPFVSVSDKGWWVFFVDTHTFTLAGPYGEAGPLYNDQMKS